MTPNEQSRESRSQLSAEEILKEKERIEQEYGKWTAHNLRLTNNIYTLSPPYDWAHHRGKWFGLLAEVLLRQPLRNMRVLDIGCLEGGITLALGEAGGPVVGIDIRDANLAKANFARDVLGLFNVEFLQADMLNLLDYNLGTFDVIVCAGTLYHIDAPDIIPFLQTIKQCCSGIAIFDTHFSVEHREEFVSSTGNRYYGRTFVESHHYTDDIEEKKKDLWGSLQNNLSFWPTERSLINFLIDAGFQFVTKPAVPVMEWPWQDRGFWVAYPDISHLLSEKYSYSAGRLADPNDRAPYHEMLDHPTQKNASNPATRRLTND
jgi:2-polyprenyl-3-methyl-5-hydroxy-6-metoxy-1,4-benzoquinol methylase